MEFVQFYPTARGKQGSRLLLYEKMLVQKGVVLKNSDGEDILRKNDKDPARITRDQLAQLIIKEIKDSPEGKQKIIMDLESLSEQTAKELTQLLPPSWWKGEKTYEVVPTTHFCMGGIRHGGREKKLLRLFPQRIFVWEVSKLINGEQRP
jgi:aspartate oxidase